MNDQLNKVTRTYEFWTCRDGHGLLRVWVLRDGRPVARWDSFSRVHGHTETVYDSDLDGELELGLLKREVRNRFDRDTTFLPSKGFGRPSPGLDWEKGSPEELTYVDGE